MPQTDFLAGQSEITASMRGELVNWLVAVADRFYMDPDTIHLAVYILDRHTACVQIKRSTYQLAGACALFTAAKVNEIHAPQLINFRRLCSDQYSREDFINMERALLQSVNFELTVPTSFQFGQRFSQLLDLDFTAYSLGQYL
jgi:hypothetical protein